MFTPSFTMKVTVRQALVHTFGHTISCRACPYRRHLANDDPFWSRWPGWMSLSVIETFALCSACGRRGCDIQAASPQTTGGFGKPPPGD
jgi:hypothetical protein